MKYQTDVTIGSLIQCPVFRAPSIFMFILDLYYCVVVRRASVVVVVVHLQIQGRMQVFKTTHQNRGPTALGPSPSDAARKMLLKSWVNITRGAWKICFMVDLLHHNYFGPNVDINFCELEKIVIVISAATKTYCAERRTLGALTAQRFGIVTPQKNQWVLLCQ